MTFSRVHVWIIHHATLQNLFRVAIKISIKHYNAAICKQLTNADFAGKCDVMKMALHGWNSLVHQKVIEAFIIRIFGRIYMAYAILSHWQVNEWSHRISQGSVLHQVPWSRLVIPSTRVPQHFCIKHIIKTNEENEARNRHHEEPGYRLIKCRCQLMD